MELQEIKKSVTNSPDNPAERAREGSEWKNKRKSYGSLEIAKSDLYFVHFPQYEASVKQSKFNIDLVESSENA